MGTNYYARQNACPTCGHSHHEVHIGKSSCGWHFALHVTPSLKTLENWIDYWSDDSISIFDEYERRIDKNDMIEIITKRSHPHGLTKHAVDGVHCVGNGNGPYDYISGDFS